MTVTALWQRAETAFRDGRGRGLLLSLLLHGLGAFLVLMTLPGILQDFDDLAPFIPVELVSSGDMAGSPGQADTLTQPAPAPAEINSPTLTEHPLPAVTPRHQRPAPPESGNSRRHPKDQAASGLPTPRPRARAQDSQGKMPIIGDGTATGTGSGGPFDVKDFLRAQVERHWEFDVSRLGKADMVVSIHLLLDSDGAVRKAEIVDDPRYLTSDAFKSVADSARRAVLVASPLQFPSGKFAVVNDVTLDLNPRDALR